MTEYGSLANVIAGRDRRTIPAVGGDIRAAALLHAVRQCHLSVSFAPIANAEKPVTGESLATFLQHLIGRKRNEALYCIFLDGAHRMIACEEMGRGGVDSCSVEPGEIVLRAVDLSARRLIVAHNHPSGDARPSAGDQFFTQTLAAACGVFQISLVDHLVITSDGFFSFRAHGYL